MGDVEGSRDLFRSTCHKNMWNNREISWNCGFLNEWLVIISWNCFCLFPAAVGSKMVVLLMLILSLLLPLYMQILCLVLVCLFVCLIRFFTSHQQSFSYKGTGLPGLNQY